MGTTSPDTNTTPEAAFLLRVEAIADAEQAQRQALRTALEQELDGLGEDAESLALAGIDTKVIHALYDILPQIREQQDRAAKGLEIYPLLAPIKHDSTAILGAATLAAHATASEVPFYYCNTTVTASPELSLEQLEATYAQAWRTSIIAQ